MALTPFLNGDTRSTSVANLIRCILDDCHRDLQSVLEEAVQGDDESRAQALLRFTHAAQQRLLRLRAILGHPVRMRHAGGCKVLEWLSALQMHDAELQAAPQTLHNSHHDLAVLLPVPIFDVSTALTVFTRGFMPLPAFIGMHNQAPKRPSGRRRRLLLAQANAFVYKLLHQSRLPKGLKLLQVESIKAVMGADCGYEVVVLLEPAPPTPLDAIVDGVLQLLKEPAGAGDAAEADSKAGAAADSAADAGGSRNEPAAPQLSREDVVAHLAAVGFTAESFAAAQPQWRWRIINVAVSAGSGGGHRMTKGQGQFVRTDLDYRMLHIRHAAMTHHIARLVRTRMAGDVPAADRNAAAAAAAASADVAAATAADVEMAEAGAAAAPAASQGTSGSLQQAASITLAKTGGSADKCLREEYSNLLEAALSMPLAIMHSVLHDVTASLTFNAAAAAARSLKHPPHRWRHHISVSTAVRCVQAGVRIELWRNAPLTRAVAAEDNEAAGAADTAAAASDGLRSQPGIVVPAVEVGSLHGGVVCVCEPTMHELWGQAGVQQDVGVEAREPEFDPVDVDLESALLDAASSWALMQLVLLRKLVEMNIRAQGWTCADLEVELKVVHSDSAAALLRGGPCADGCASRAAEAQTKGLTVHGAETLSSLASAVRGMADRRGFAELDGAAGAPALQLQQPHTDARPGPVDAAGTANPHRGLAALRGRKGHERFAKASGVQEAAEERRRVPALLVDVRRHLAAAVTLDLISGAVCLHAGDSQVQGLVFTTALELESQQGVLRRIQDGEPPSSTPVGTPLAMLAHELSRFLVQRLLASRAANRAAAARALRLVPLLPPMTAATADPRVSPGWRPFPESALAAYFSKFPAARAHFPQHARFLAMPPSPASLPLCIILSRNRLHMLRGHETTVSRNNWQRMQFTLAVGLDPAALQEEAAEEPGPPAGAPPCSRPPKRVHARMCAALVCSLTSSAGIARLITHVEAAPPQVFTHAQSLLDEGVDADAALAAVGMRGNVEGSRWYSWVGGDSAEDRAAGARKRPRSGDGGDVAERNGVAVNGLGPNGVARKRPRGANEPPCTAAPPCAPTDGGAVTETAAGTSAEGARERMEVALMLGWLQQRALMLYLRTELDAVGAEYTELDPHAGSINPLRAKPSHPMLRLRTLPYASSGEAYKFPEEPVPWPLCVPREDTAHTVDSSVADVTVVLLSHTTWELQVESAFVATALRALQAPRGEDNLAPGSSMGTWRRHPMRPTTVIGRYSTHRSSRSGMQCWSDVLALLRTRDALVALSIVHRPPADRQTQSQGAAARGSLGIQPITFPFQACEITVTLPRLDRLRFSVTRTKCVAAAASTPMATGTEILTIDAVCEWDHRLDVARVLPQAGASPQRRIAIIVMYITSKAAVVSVSSGRPPPPGVQDRITEAVWTTLHRLDMKCFLDCLECAAEGIVEISRVVGNGRPAPLLAEHGMTCVRRLEVSIATAPSRQVVSIGANAPGSAAEVFYGVGVLLKTGGLAMLQFDPRQFQAQSDMGHSMAAMRGASAERVRHRQMLQVPEWATLVQELLSGESAVGRSAADVHSAWSADDPTGANVVVPQRLLGEVITRVVKFLDAALTRG